ncbi:UDP-N-acetyl-D-mannosamine dehydrogenase [Sinorhizobium meliloti]|uniref:UDP-N-acetyl-D-mannosamine dehydrogenase n=1 Tax=Rhizobium meliloti TaxID=382 RepID=UPI00338D4E6B
MSEAATLPAELPQVIPLARAREARTPLSIGAIREVLRMSSADEARTPLRPIETVSVVGLGYIGLPTAAVASSRGISVVGVDVNAHVVDTLNSGKIHIAEPDLDELVSTAVQDGKLRAVVKPEPADVFVIAVPTPFAEGHKPDLSYVKAAAVSIAPVLKSGDLVILESTSPVGTTGDLCRWLAEARSDLTFPDEHSEAADIRIAYCPERVLPGRVLRELVENARVIGGVSAACTRRAVEFYRIFVRGDCISTDARTAELVKLTENAFRDVNIAFANELSLVCDKVGVNVWELIRLANQHPRVNILQPGPGVGGHCIAVDPWFIVHSAPELARLIRCAREVNDGKPEWVVHQVLEQAKNFPSPRIACFGLAFKADIDDLRESPALEVVHALAKTLAGKITVVEPFVNELPMGLRGKVRLSQTTAALAEADIVVGLVDHAAFRRIDRLLLEGKAVIDTRGIWR